MSTEAQKVQTEIRRTSDASERKLLCDRFEPAWAFGVVLNGAVCLLILAGLAPLGKDGFADGEAL